MGYAHLLSKRNMARFGFGKFSRVVTIPPPGDILSHIWVKMQY